MKRVHEALKRLAEQGFTIRLEGGRIKVRYQGGRVMTQAQAKAQAPAILFLLNILRNNQAAVREYLRLWGEDHSCRDCPWCLENPWTHDPALPKWCGWWWDHLAADNPPCRDHREGLVPDPGPRTPLRGSLGKGSACFDCAHFRPPDGPNPTESWGYCRRLRSGRYGLARACDAFRAVKLKPGLPGPAVGG